MSKHVIQPIQHAIKAKIVVPGSKSITNRALIMAALAKGYSRLDGVLFSEDTEACANALNELGLKLAITPEFFTIELEGAAGKFPHNNAAIYCKDAGTATRFLIPACAAMDKGSYQFSATPRMSERPLKPLLDVIQSQGANFMYHQDHSYRMPFTLHAKNGLKGGEVKVDIQDSSQFFSGLMIAAPYARKPMVLSSTKPLNQKTYVHMTVQMMAEFGIETKWIDDKTLYIPQGIYQGQQYQIEPDASTASYFFAMAAITAGTMHVPNLSRSCKQGDIQFASVLEKMGCKLIEEQGGITVIGAKQLKGLGDVDMTGFSDTFMTLACIAPFANAPTIMHGLAHTRLQESDRIAAIADGLSRLGIRIESTQDSLAVYPSRPHGANVESYRDHRIAMSLSLIGLKIPGVVISGADCVAKTCPNYFDLFLQACA